MKTMLSKHPVVYNSAVFFAWAVTSFFCHYTAKIFLTQTDVHGRDSDDVLLGSVLTPLLNATILTGCQLALCAAFIGVEARETTDAVWNVRMVKLYHASATFATNVSLAFTFASSTFAIKMMEPVISSLVQYTLSGTTLSPLAVVSIPLIMGGAIAFSDTPINISNNYVGVAAALASNVILALRNITIKQLIQGPKDKSSSLLSPTLRPPISAVAILMGVLLYLNVTQDEDTPLLFTSHLLTVLYISLSGVFHVVYSFISTGLVLTQISVVSHAVVNIMKRLLVVILLHVLGTRVATFHNFLGLAVCTMGLLLYGWDKSRHIHGVNNNHGTDLSLMVSITKSTKIIRILCLFCFITFISIFLLQSEPSFISHKYLGNRYLGKPREYNVSFSPQGESPKTVLHILTQNIITEASPYISNFNQPIRDLTTSDKIIRESQNYHFSILGKELQKFKYAFLFDVAAFENKGDPCITAGEVYFIARMHMKLLYYCTSKKCTKANLFKAKELSRKYNPDNLVILLQGGGNIIGYEASDVTRFRILAMFSEFKIFIFPQSIWIRDPSSPNVRQTIKYYCCNPNLVIVLRDTNSYNLAKDLYNGSTRLLMAPDMAFQIGPVPRFMSPVYDILWLKRSDSESSGYSIPYSIPSHLRVHVSDWWKWTTPKAASNLERAFLMATNGFFYLQRGRVIITDRLHGHILSTLMDIPHVLIDNKAKKLSSYHKTWTSSLSNVVITDNPTYALNLAIGLLEKYNETLPPVIPFLNLKEDFSYNIGVMDFSHP